MIWVQPGAIQPKVELTAEAAGADVTQLIATVSLALAAEADVELREMLRQSSNCRARRVHRPNNRGG